MTGATHGYAARWAIEVGVGLQTLRAHHVGILAREGEALPSSPILVRLRLQNPDSKVP